MNYNARDDENDSELFVMLKSTKVEIKKEHQVLMIDKTTSFKKRLKGKKGKLHEWQASCPSSEETQEPKPET